MLLNLFGRSKSKASIQLRVSKVKILVTSSQCDLYNPWSTHTKYHKQTLPFTPSKLFLIYQLYFKIPCTALFSSLNLPYKNSESQNSIKIQLVVLYSSFPMPLTSYFCDFSTILYDFSKTELQHDFQTWKESYFSQFHDKSQTI